MSSIKQRLKLIKRDTTQEDEILTAMIVSDEFCKGIMPMLDLELLRTPYVRIVSDWCRGYFNEYGKAPGRHVHDLYQTWKSRQRDEALVGLLEDFLLRLSSAYEKWESINPDFLLDKAEAYFKEQRIETAIDDAQTRLRNNDTEGAAQALGSFKDVSSGSLLSKLEDIAVSATDFMAQAIKEPMAYIRLFLREGTLTMVYGPKGVGKSWLTYALALSLTRKRFDDIEIGPWSVRNPAGVLILDGEMHPYEMQYRLKTLSGPLGEMDPENPLVIISAIQLGKRHGCEPDLTDKEWRNVVTSYLERNPHLKVLVLDNLSSLAQTEDDNSTTDWSPINQWLLKLRGMDVSVVMVHHANKMGTDRGTSKRTDNLDTVIKLTKPADSKADDGAYFNVSFDKGRSLKAGEAEAFTLRIRPHETHPTWSIWTTKNESVGNKRHLITALLLDGRTKATRIAEIMQVTRQYVTNVKKGIIAESLMDRDGKTTKMGREFLKPFDMEKIMKEMEGE